MIEYKNNRSQIIVNHRISVELDPLVTEYYYTENGATPLSGKGIPILPGETHSVTAIVSGYIDTGVVAAPFAYEVKGAIYRDTVANGGAISADYMDTIDGLRVGLAPFTPVVGLFYLSVPLAGNGSEYFFNLNPDAADLTTFDGYIFKSNVTLYISNYKI
jgi:hypothetical protein